MRFLQPAKARVEDTSVAAASEPTAEAATGKNPERQGANLPYASRIPDRQSGWRPGRRISVVRARQGLERRYLACHGAPLAESAKLSRCLPPLTRSCHVLDWFLRADRKSTRLNSSHLGISYAVFCLK